MARFTETLALYADLRSDSQLTIRLPQRMVDDLKKVSDIKGFSQGYLVRKEIARLIHQNIRR